MIISFNVMYLKINIIMNGIKNVVVSVWNKIFNAVDHKIIRVKFSKYKCSTCTVREAKWKNTFSALYACDECVPRGCSCRLYRKAKRAAFLIKQYDYQKDKKGKLLHCEDWIKL